MVLSLTCLLISIISLFVCVNKFPTITFKTKKINFTIQTFYIIPFISALILIIFKAVSKTDLLSLIDFSLPVNPIKILILFISISFISICLDKAGFFSMCASKALNKAKGSNLLFFILLYLTVSILTIFTSNDIVVLTFTPFICYYTAIKKTNPLPYLFIEFIAANSWSMMLEIGNPTNIYLALSANISFIEYFKIMFLPTFISCLSSFFLVIFIFRKSIFSYKKDNLDQKISNFQYSIDRNMIIVSLIHLIICLFGLIFFSDYMYIVCLICAISLSVFMIVNDIIHKTKISIEVYKKLPYAMIPFILSMYIIVCSLNNANVTDIIANGLNTLAINDLTTALTYGYTSIISCNILNNIPMSILYSSILANNNNIIAIYATIIGSNLGVLLTPIGALAGIMWLSILKNQNIKISFTSFTKYCGIICFFTALIAFITLAIVI